MRPRRGSISGAIPDAFIASRVAAGLRQVLEKAASKKTQCRCRHFFMRARWRSCRSPDPGLVGLAVMAFQEVKAVFRERLRPHIGSEKYELSLNDCHVVRENFSYPKFDEYTYPSADLQIAAESIEAVARGEYHWIVAAASARRTAASLQSMGLSRQSCAS